MSQTASGIHLNNNRSNKILLPKCLLNIFTNPIYLKKEDEIYYESSAYKEHPIFKKIDKLGKLSYKIYDDNKNQNIRIIEHGCNHNDNIYKTIINRQTGRVSTESTALAMAVMDNLARGEFLYISITGDPSNESQINDHVAFIMQIQTNPKYKDKFEISQPQGEKGLFMAEVLKKVYRSPSPPANKKTPEPSAPPAPPAAPPNALKNVLEHLKQEKQEKQDTSLGTEI